MPQQPSDRQATASSPICSLKNSVGLKLPQMVRTGMNDCLSNCAAGPGGPSAHLVYNTVFFSRRITHCFPRKGLSLCGWQATRVLPAPSVTQGVEQRRELLLWCITLPQPLTSALCHCAVSKPLQPCPMVIATDTLMVPGDGWRPAESGGRDIIFTSHQGTPKATFQTTS